MKIALFHYHLKPGGVTDVIVYSVRAILSRMNRLEEIRLITGNTENTENVLKRIRNGFNRQLANKIRLDILKEIDYVEHDAGPDPDQLTSRLLARYDKNTLWWIHNYHLGKNPWFTAALMNVAKSGNVNMLFHIHDFPECGRSENLNRLNSILNTPPYPSGPRIRYAAINARDQKILSDAGMQGSVFFLPNLVPLDIPGQVDPEQTQQALKELCAKDNPGFLPDAPLVLYPVRAIRRKNIFEAALLVKLLDEPANLIVTLPGISAQEKHYSSLVEKAFRSGLIPGVWCPEATGDKRLSYRCLAASSNAIISTSIQEGFGYLFFNAMHWQKPILARYLDILDGILDYFGDYPRRFWADFRIAVSRELIQSTQEAYLKRIKKMETTLSGKSIKSMTSAVSKIASGGGMDISYLKVEDQIKALKSVDTDAEWLEKTVQLNRELLESVGRTLKAKAPPMDQTIEAHFGEAVFVRKFNEIITGFGEKTPFHSPGKVRESVEKSFGRIDYLRLLYDD